jgi:hypothetical protein
MDTVGHKVRSTTPPSVPQQVIECGTHPPEHMQIVAPEKAYIRIAKCITKDTHRLRYYELQYGMKLYQWQEDSQIRWIGVARCHEKPGMSFELHLPVLGVRSIELSTIPIVVITHRYY